MKIRLPALLKAAFLLLLIINFNGAIVFAENKVEPAKLSPNTQTDVAKPGIKATNQDSSVICKTQSNAQPSANIEPSAPTLDYLGTITYIIAAIGLVVTLLSFTTQFYASRIIYSSNAYKAELTKSFAAIQATTLNSFARQSKLVEIKYLYWSLLTDSTSSAESDDDFTTRDPMALHLGQQTKICELERRLMQLENDDPDVVCNALRAIGNYNTPVDLAKKLADYLRLIKRQTVFDKPSLNADQEEIDRVYKQVLNNLDPTNLR